MNFVYSSFVVSICLFFLATNVTAQQEAIETIEVIGNAGDIREIGKLSVDTPIAGTVIEYEEMELVKSANTLRELLTRVPGVAMIRNIRIPIGGRGYTNNLIDGLSVQSQSLGTFSFIDDFNTWDIERVDVVRGPGSVLHSSKAFGGTINIITRNPSEDPELRTWAETGSYGFRRIGAHATNTFDNDIGFMANVNHTDNEAWRDRTAEEKTAMSVKLISPIGNRNRMSFRIEHVDTYVEMPGNLSEIQFNDNWQQAGANNYYTDYNLTTGYLALESLIGDNGKLDLTAVRRYNKGTDACPAGCSAAATTRQDEQDYLDNNFRAVYRHDFGAFDSRVYAGVDAFFSDKLDEVYNRTGFDRTTLRSASEIKETNLAPFIQYEFSPLERLNLFFGLRNEDYKLDIDDQSPTTNRDGKTDYSRLIKKAGLTFNLTSDDIVWANIGQGYFIPGSANTVTAANPNPDLPPETGFSYEAGVRGNLSGSPFRYDIGIYRTDIKDMTIAQPCNGSAILCPGARGPRDTYFVAAGKVKFSGIESSLSWQPMEMVKFGLSHTYAKNEFVDFIEAPIDYSGKTYQSSPKHHLNGRVTVYPLTGLRAELESDLISSYYTNNLNTDEYKRPTLFHLRVNYKIQDRWEFWLHGLNLLDKQYGSRVSSTTTAIPVRSFSEGYSPRTVRGGISYLW